MDTIVHVIDNLGVGGAQAMMFELHYAINKYYGKEYQQFILTRDRKKIDTQFVETHGVGYNLIYKMEMLVKRIVSYKNGIVFYHKLAGSGPELVNLIRDKSPKIPIIVINHTLYKPVAWRSMKKCDVIVSVSSHMKQHMKKWCPKVNHTRIYNSVNYDRYESVPCAKKYSNDVLVTGRINRLCGWKYSSDWLEQCLTVPLPKQMIHEYIGGGPREYEAMRFMKKVAAKRKKKKKYRNKVKLLGNIEDFNKKISILKRWDLFLYETNRNEGISMSILEALACGVPVICSNNHGNIEIIEDGVNGYVFKTWAEAQKILMKLITNPSKLEKLKKSTKEHFIKNLNGDICASQYIGLVRKITGK